jgi:hypothetical protein
MMSNTMLVGAFVGAMVVNAAVFFELGRKSFKEEILRSWYNARCRECGAQPEPRILHVSGCESGWPDPAKLFETQGP